LQEEILSSTTLLAGGRPSFVSVSTQQYIAKMLQNGKQNGPKTVQEYLRLIKIHMSMSVVGKLLMRIDFKQKRKIKANFSRKRTSLLGWHGPKNTSILR
jgi:macrodomain Ter protein organizer (MatP/YcbG family)